MAKGGQNPTFGDPEYRLVRGFSRRRQTGVGKARDHIGIGGVGGIGAGGTGRGDHRRGLHRRQIGVGLTFDAGRTIAIGNANNLGAVGGPQRVEGTVHRRRYHRAGIGVDDQNARHHACLGCGLPLTPAPSTPIHNSPWTSPDCQRSR